MPDGEKEDRDSLVWYELGMLYYTKKDYAGAVLPLRRSAELMPSRTALYGICALYVRKGMTDKAETVLERNKIGRTSGWVHLAQAAVYEAKKNLAGAAISYNVALKLLPRSAAAHAGLGRVFLEQARYNDAIEHFGMAAGYDPGNQDLYNGMGRAYLGMRNYSSAIETFTEVLAKQPDNEDAYLLLAQAYASKQYRTKAIEVLDKGVERFPRNGNMYLKLGDLNRQAKKYDLAIAHYEKAARLGKNTAIEAYRGLGDVYWLGLKDKKNAEKNYNKYIKAGGDQAAIRSVLKAMGQ